MTSEKRYFDLCLAALLHDIGKLDYRCLPEHMIKPDKEGRKPTHETLGKRIIRETIGEIYIDFMEYLQHPIVEIADWISAQEREEQEDRPDVREIGLLCIFSSLKIEDFRIKNHIWKPAELSLNYEKLFPIEERKINISKEGGEDLSIKIREELKKVSRDLIKLKELELEGEKSKNYVYKLRKNILRKVLDILKKYAIFIPSASYWHKPDIDLYSHSKISCAVAASLFKYITEKNKEDLITKIRKRMIEEFDKKQKNQETYEKIENEDVLNEKIFLLIIGDFSGIQDFISTLSTENAIKHLKARSFYLNYLNKLLARYITDALYLPESNIIFASGGNFEILAPNTDITLNKLKEIVSQINNFFFKKFGIKIYLSIKVYELSPSDFQRALFVEKIRKGESIDISSKYKKFLGVIDLFETKDLQDNCKICHSKMLKRGEKCEVCDEIENFRKIIKEWQKKKTINVKDLKDNKLFDKNWLDSITYEENINSCNDVFDFYSLGIPLDKNGDIINISEFSKLAEEETGYGKLGALKIDLDNLGIIFTKALEKPTLSTYSRLSFDISLFFDGIVNSLVDKYENKIYLIYSGGDDLFAIGPWHILLDFCKDLAIIFRKYVCNHNKITISGAFGFYGDKYPIKKIFEEINEKLEKSKKLDGKNGLTIFDLPIKFYVPDELSEITLRKCEIDIDSEFEKIRSIINNFYKNSRNEKEFELYFRLTILLSKLVKEKLISRGFLERLITTTEDLPEIFELDKNNISLRPKWIIDYYLKRAKKKDNEKIIDKLLNIWKEIYFKYLDGTFILLPIVRMAAKTAQLYTKKGEGYKYG
jgi:CRISPR-associated protein Csm1